MENDRKKCLKKDINIHNTQLQANPKKRREGNFYPFFSVSQKKNVTYPRAPSKNQTKHITLIPQKMKKKTVQDISNFANFVNTCLAAQLKYNKKSVFLLEVKNI